jgi:hypothetical protein
MGPVPRAQFSRSFDSLALRWEHVARAVGICRADGIVAFVTALNVDTLVFDNALQVVACPRRSPGMTINT